MAHRSVIYNKSIRMPASKIIWFAAAEKLASPLARQCRLTWHRTPVQLVRGPANEKSPGHLRHH